MQCIKFATIICNMESNPTKDYLVGVTIGEGSFGRVVHARHKVSGKDVAIKVFDKASLRKQPQRLPSIWNERTLLLEFQSCPYVVNLWAAFVDQECIYLVMECLKGGDLQGLIQSGLAATVDRRWWKTAVVPHYSLQLVRAVEFLHEHNTIHADLKPQNILVTCKGRIQLADFGSAIRLTKENVNKQTGSNGEEQSGGQGIRTVLGGTVDYASPEIVRGTDVAQLTAGTDMWSLGCILHALYSSTALSPFHASSDALAVKSITDYCNGNTALNLFTDEKDNDESQNQAWRSLVLGLLHPIPTKRLGAVGKGSIGDLIPDIHAVDMVSNPPFLPTEPMWMQEARETNMRDGCLGWSVFLL